MGKRRQQRRAKERAEREGNLKIFLGEAMAQKEIRDWEKRGMVDPEPATIRDHKRVPDGEWTDVAPGQVIAMGTYVDDAGVLRSTGDGSCVVWHNSGGGCGPTGTKGDYKKKILAAEIIYDDNGAPWCPQCVANNQRAKIVEKQLTAVNNQRAKIVEKQLTAVNNQRAKIVEKQLADVNDAFRSKQLKQVLPEESRRSSIERFNERVRQPFQRTVRQSFQRTLQAQDDKYDRHPKPVKITTAAELHQMRVEADALAERQALESLKKNGAN